MVLLRLVVSLFLLVSLAEGKLKGSHRPQGHRELQVLIEDHVCIPFEDPQVENAKGSNDDNADPECDTNDCSGGCCRFHTQMLRCDEVNDFRHQPVSVVLCCVVLCCAMGEYCFVVARISNPHNSVAAASSKTTIYSASAMKILPGRWVLRTLRHLRKLLRHLLNHQRTGEIFHRVLPCPFRHQLMLANCPLCFKLYQVTPDANTLPNAMSRPMLTIAASKPIVSAKYPTFLLGSVVLLGKLLRDKKRYHECSVSSEA
jgi:hypothetical protein